MAPLAAAGLTLGLWTHRHAARTHPGRAAYLLWGGWAVVSWVVFSFSQGIFHPYYTVLMAPAVAALAAGALVELWQRSRRASAWSAVLALCVIATAALAALLLSRATGFVPWLAPVAVALSAIAAAGLALRSVMAGRRPPGRHALRRPSARRTVTVGAALAGLLAVLAGPASYAVATVGDTLSGGDPLAGPMTGTGFAGAPGGPSSSAGRGAPGRAAGRGRLPPPSPPVAGGQPDRPPAGARALFGPSPPDASSSGDGARLSAGGGPRGGDGPLGATASPGGGMGGSVSKATIEYLKAHQDGARYLVAAVGSNASASIALASGRDVINMGGFMGSDPSPSLTQLKRLVDTGQLHYVLLSTGASPGGPGGPSASGSAHAGGGPGGGGGLSGPGGPGGSSAVSTERDDWIESHGKVVTTSANSMGTTLYYLPSSP